MMSEQVETNHISVPFLFEKVVTGSFHQGDVRFCYSAGKQCVAMSLYAAAFATIKGISYWSSNTLDSILEYGGRFYKSIGIDRFSWCRGPSRHSAYS